jgi:hypothetical protein
MISVVLSLCAFGAAQPPTHEASNSLYKELLDTGVSVGDNVKARFPTPTMPDGLDAARQKAVIVGLIGGDYSFEEFTRKSTVAPQLLKLRDVNPSDPKAPARGVDAWFLVHGDLKVLDDEKSVDKLVGAGRGEGKGTALKNADLMKRSIPIPANKGDGYGTLEFDFLEKVRLKATGRGVSSKLGESFVAAAVVDPRFLGDKEFPNQWQSLEKVGGVQKVGPATPWNGGGFYMKITKLTEPAGALFVEQHVIFTEPTGWFDGANLLRSKLPIVVQTNVRNMRKEWLKASGK